MYLNYAGIIALHAWNKGKAETNRITGSISTDIRNLELFGPYI